MPYPARIGRPNRLTVEDIDMRKSIYLPSLVALVTRYYNIEE